MCKIISSGTTQLPRLDDETILLGGVLTLTGGIFEIEWRVAFNPPLRAGVLRRSGSFGRSLLDTTPPTDCLALFREVDILVVRGGVVVGADISGAVGRTTARGGVFRPPVAFPVD